MAKKDFTQASYDVDNVQGLPNQVKGQASTVKETFDKASLDIRTFINTVLLSELENTTLNESGSFGIGHNSPDITADNVGDGLEELQQAIQDIIAGEISVNTITNALLAGDVKVGSLASLLTTANDNVTNAINEIYNSVDNVENTILTPSSLLQGLEIDTDGAISLTQFPSTMTDTERITFQETSTFNTDQYVEFSLPFTIGRVIILMIKRTNDASKWLLSFIDMKSGDAIINIGTDWNGNVKTSLNEEMIGNFVNGTSSLGCGTFTSDSGDEYFYGFEYDKDYGIWGAIRFNFASAGTFPIDFNFDVTYIGVV